jgi:hypothetical protein
LTEDTIADERGRGRSEIDEGDARAGARLTEFAAHADLGLIGSRLHRVGDPLGIRTLGAAGVAIWDAARDLGDAVHPDGLAARPVHLDQPAVGVDEAAPIVERRRDAALSAASGRTDATARTGSSTRAARVASRRAPSATNAARRAFARVILRV